MSVSLTSIIAAIEESLESCGLNPDDIGTTVCNFKYNVDSTSEIPPQFEQVQREPFCARAANKELQN